MSPPGGSSPPGGVAFVEEPHHDGSSLYLPEPPTDLGEDFDVFLMVPRAAGVSRVSVRQVHDGEPFSVAARLDRSDAHFDWYRATLQQHNPVVPYRFLTDAGPNGYRWITAAGPVDHDPADAGDFRSSVHAGGPTWLDSAVAYQIFPDRFARSGTVNEPTPAWARPASWDDEPIYQGRDTPRQLFGGDLPGIQSRLEHIAALGADLLYLTPVFTAPSNHRYNAASFDHIDALLGGDRAYVELIEAAHRRGMRIIGDITTNHTGSMHDWFRSAQADAGSEEASYYYFRDHPEDYVGWFGVRHLPKLDYRNPALMQRMVTGETSPIRTYLRQPYGLDGWRVDVANMTGRQGDVDVNHFVAHAVRRVVTEENPDALLVGEHFHDFLTDLDGSGWQGVMNYAGFSKPVWSWLTRPDLPMDNWMGIPWSGWPRTPGTALVGSMRDFSAVGWQHRLASMLIVSSHDSPRIRTITGDPALVEVAVAAMMTMPGLPMVWAGDEIGQEGITGEDARRPFPWHRPESWDMRTLDAYRSLIALRRDHEALRSGSLRWVYADAHRVVYLRETAAQRVLVLLSRGSGPNISVPVGALGLQDDQQFDSLYSETTARRIGDRLVISGDGPAVGVWRW